MGLILVTAEVFIPSGGVLGLLSISSILAGIVLAFYYRGAEVGLIFLAVTVVTVPTALGRGVSLLAQDRHGAATAVEAADQ